MFSATIVSAPELTIPEDYTIECSEELILEDASATDNCGEVEISVVETMVAPQGLDDDVTATTTILKVVRFKTLLTTGGSSISISSNAYKDVQRSLHDNHYPNRCRHNFYTDLSLALDTYDGDVQKWFHF